MENNELICGIFNSLIPLTSALLGIIIGGLISYLSVRASDNRKWAQEKVDRISKEQRDAIGMALEWCEPIRRNISKARLLTGTFLQGWISTDDLRSQWPNMLTTLAHVNLPARLQVWLPPDTYKSALDIAAEVDNFAVNIEAFPTQPDEWHRRFTTYSDFFGETIKKLDSLESNLTNAYRQTFN